MERPDTEQSRHYQVIANAIAFIRAHALEQPSLDEIAAALESALAIDRLLT